MKRSSLVLLAALAPLVIGSMNCDGCKKDEDPPPLPSSSGPFIAPPPTVVLVPIPDDAGVEPPDAAPDARGPAGPSNFGNLRACCAALQSNAASTPPPQNMWLLAAAQYCQATVSSVNSPQQKDAVLAGIRNALRGATLPSSCR